MLLNPVPVMADDCLGMLTRFAGPDTLIPCVLQIGVTTTSAGSEPRTAATATTHFARLHNRNTFGTYGTYDRRRDCWCLYVGIGHKNEKERNTKITFNLLLQASMPSNHLCTSFRFPAPPQFLNQAPPGAQQLARPDFSNVPHFEHASPALVKAKAGVLINVVIGVLDMSSRSLSVSETMMLQGFFARACGFVGVWVCGCVGARVEIECVCV